MGLVLYGESGREFFSGSISMELSDSVVLGSFSLRKRVMVLSPQIHMSPRRKGQTGEVSDRQVANKQ